MRPQPARWWATDHVLRPPHQGWGLLSASSGDFYVAIDRPPCGFEDSRVDEGWKGVASRPLLTKREQILAATLTPPEATTQWSRARLAKQVGVSASTVGRVWAEERLKPHRSETFKYSRDPELTAKIADVVGLYLAPPERAIVLSVDEKTQIQALDRTQPMLPMKPGQVDRHAHDCKRNGTLRGSASSAARLSAGAAASRTSASSQQRSSPSPATGTPARPRSPGSRPPTRSSPRRSARRKPIPARDTSQRASVPRARARCLRRPLPRREAPSGAEPRRARG